MGCHFTRAHLAECCLDFYACCNVKQTPCCSMISSRTPAEIYLARLRSQENLTLITVPLIHSINY